MSAGLRFGIGPLSWYIPLTRKRYWKHPGCPMHHSRPDRCAERMARARGEYRVTAETGEDYDARIAGFRLARRQQVPQENRHRLHDLAAGADHSIRLTGIASGHETARPRHHEPRQVASLFLIRFDHADKLASVTENPP